MKGLLTANVKAHGRRYSATAVAVALATIFIMVCFGLVGGIQTSTRSQFASEIKGATGIVRNVDSQANAEDEASISHQILEKLRSDPAIADAQPLYTTFDQIKSQDRSKNEYVQLQQINPQPFYQPPLEAGSLAVGANEIVVMDAVANSMHLSVGDMIHLGSEEQTFKVVGLSKTPTGLAFPAVYLTADGMERAWPGLDPTEVMFKTKDMSADEAITHVSQILTGMGVKQEEGGTYVQSADEYVKAKMNSFMVGFTVLLGIVMVFPAIAAITAIIVISTTFQVMLAQRQRELALLRSIGADTAQIRRLVIRENLLVGAISSFIGVVIGTFLAGIINMKAHMSSTFVEGITSVPWWAYVATFMVGVVITLVAGLRPALKVSRVSPMVALSPVEPEGVQRKKRLARLITGIVITGLGLLVIMLAVVHPDFGKEGAPFGIAFLGGMVTFIGALVLLTWLLPYITNGVGKLVGGKSATMQLAAENTWRNPARTGATGTALVLGVTLVVMMMVGAQSLQDTVLKELDLRRPIDIVVEKLDNTPLTDEDVQAVNNISGVVQSIEVRGFVVENEDEVLRVNEGRDLSGVSHKPLLAPQEGVVDVDSWLWDENEKEHTFDLGSQSITLKTNLARTPHYTVSPKDYQVLREAAGDEAQESSTLYVRIRDNMSMEEVKQLTSDISVAVKDASVGGSAQERAMWKTMISSLLMSTIVMLAISVLVALVGVANTLSLSVVERRRENALLRALGMTKANVRKMITLETVLIAGVSVFLGILMGVAFGTLGLMALPLNFSDAGQDFHRVVSIPWLQVGGAILVAFGAAMLSSIMPGRRAAKASPIEAMAEIE